MNSPEARSELFDQEQAIERDGARYLRSLDLSWDDLVGRRLLDVGAGRANFARAAQRHGIDVISIDRDPSRTGAGIPNDVDYRVTEADDLSALSDDSIDLAVSLGGPLGTLKDGTRWQASFAELQRVLRPGGELRFGSGNLSPGIIAPDLATLRLQFPVIERQRILRDRTVEFLRSVDPSFQVVTDQDGDIRYCRYQKPPLNQSPALDSLSSTA